jgi:ribosomal protein S18 acetylase RimI-like enzyme
MTVTLEPASILDDERLAALFTAVYAGYWHPIEIDAAGLRHMVETHDLDLDASVAALDAGVPVAVAMLAIRGTEGWIGGMGVLPERRGAGVGTQVTAQLLANARDRRLRRIRLEVLEQNAPAISIYRRLGFADLGDVGVWALTVPPDAEPAQEAALDETLETLASTSSDAPWQRGAATIARMHETGGTLAAVRAAGGAAVFSVNGEQAVLLEISAPDVRSARGLLRAPFERGASSLLFVNGPVTGVMADVLDAAGATRLALQHELAIEL